MATYHVWSGGSNTSPYDTWAKAATTFTTANAAATSAADIIKVQYTHQENIAAHTLYEVRAGLVVSVDKDNADTPTEMGTSGWLGSSSSAYQVGMNAYDAYNVRVWGLTLRTGSTFSVRVGMADSTSKRSMVFENGLLWTAAVITIGDSGTTGSKDGNFVRVKNTEFRFAATTGSVSVSLGRVELENCSVDPAGSTPTTLFTSTTDSYMGSGVELIADGCDFSAVTGTLVGASTATQPIWSTTLRNCKLGSGVTVFAANTTTGHPAGNQVQLFNCASGDTHYQFGYYTDFGTLLMETSIYANDGAAYDGTNRASWKVTTTSRASSAVPFVTPWIEKYHDGTSAITPYLEVLRDGSTTAYNDDELWGEFSAQTNTGSTQASFVDDRATVLATGSAQAAGVGTSGWTGEAASAWSGKLAPGSTITPAEVGFLRARVCFGKASSTVYIDPQIRT